MSDLHTLIGTGESLTLELKKSTAEKDRACRTLCAFANGRGGQVVFGVTPAGKVVGQNVADHTLEELAQEFQSFDLKQLWLLEDMNGVQVLRLKAPRTKDIGYVRRTINEFLLPFIIQS